MVPNSIAEHNLKWSSTRVWLKNVVASFLLAFTGWTIEYPNQPQDDLSNFSSFLLFTLLVYNFIVTPANVFTSFNQHNLYFHSYCNPFNNFIRSMFQLYVFSFLSNQTSISYRSQNFHFIYNFEGYGRKQLWSYILLSWHLPGGTEKNHKNRRG